ncbi:hypothetical protein PTKIN_Ptkin11bG0029300 [Pterospermum kingtungense]
MGLQTGSRGAASAQTKAVDHCERLRRLVAMKESSPGSPIIGCFFSNERKQVDCTHSEHLSHHQLVKDVTIHSRWKRHQTDFVKGGACEAEKVPAQPQLEWNNRGYCAGASVSRCQKSINHVSAVCSGCESDITVQDKGIAAFTLSLHNLNGEKKKQQQLVVEEGIDSANGDEKYRSALMSISYSYSPDTKGSPSTPNGISIEWVHVVMYY